MLINKEFKLPQDKELATEFKIVGHMVSALGSLLDQDNPSPVDVLDHLDLMSEWASRVGDACQEIADEAKQKEVYEKIGFERQDGVVEVRLAQSDLQAKLEDFHLAECDREENMYRCGGATTNQRRTWNTIETFLQDVPNVNFVIQGPLSQQ
jgi:hypothetical protein